MNLKFKLQKMLLLKLNLIENYYYQPKNILNKLIILNGFQ